MKLHLIESLNLNPKSIEVIPNPILGCAEARQLTRTEGPNREFLVVSCGRLTEQKDFSTLLRAIALVDTAIRMKLVILGEGPLRAALEVLATRLGIADAVEFVGHSPDPSIWLKRADVFALSSRWEGFPNVLLEAIACGCPVVATDCSDAVPQLLDEGRLGRIVAVGCPEALAEAISQTLRNPIPVNLESEHLGKYSLARVADAYFDLLVGPISDSKEID